MDKRIKLNKYLEEIENLQEEVDKILYSKNIFIKFFKFNKAKKLHLDAQKMLDIVNDGSLLEDLE